MQTRPACDVWKLSETPRACHLPFTPAMSHRRMQRVRAETDKEGHANIRVSPDTRALVVLRAHLVDPSCP